MTDCEMVQIENEIERLDRIASVCIVTGQKVEISGLELRKVVKTVQGLAAAKAAYNHQREKLERQELHWARVVWFTLAVTATVAVIADMVGLT